MQTVEVGARDVALGAMRALPDNFCAVRSAIALPTMGASEREGDVSVLILGLDRVSLASGFALGGVARSRLAPLLQGGAVACRRSDGRVSRMGSL
ncbi:MAG: hypothetical protein JF591_05730 [Lysobacter sp.]|nr:hypothetical protein [Lysobacter sp.]